jgi:hypothetical protein
MRANDQGALAAFYFQADSAFVGYGLAPLPLEAGEMFPAPSRAALGRWYGPRRRSVAQRRWRFWPRHLYGHRTAGLARQTHAGRSGRGGAAVASERRLSWVRACHVSLPPVNSRSYANSARSFRSQPAFGAKANYRQKSDMIYGYAVSTAGQKVAVRSSNWRHAPHQPSQ